MPRLRGQGSTGPVAETQIQPIGATGQYVNVIRSDNNKKPEISLFMKSLQCLNVDICGVDLNEGHWTAASALDLGSSSIK